MNAVQRQERYIAHAQDDLNLHILRMLEGTFLLDTAHIFLTGEKEIFIQCYEGVSINNQPIPFPMD